MIGTPIHKISVVYVAYRTPSELLNSSIESVLLSAEICGAEVEVLIADNGGLRADEIDAKFVRVGDGRNLGFGEAVNACIQAASGDWVLLMNPDSLLDENALTELSVAVEGWPGPRSFFGSLLVNNQTPQLHAYNLWWFSTTLFLRKRTLAKRLNAWIAAERPVRVPRLCGAGLFAQRADLLEMGPFDTSFFLYGEDVDLSLRAARAGISQVLVPTAVIRHLAGTSSDGASALVQAARTDAHFRLLSRHKPYVIALASRGEYLFTTVLGLLVLTVRGARGAAGVRRSRLREISRWGVRKSADRFDPYAWSLAAGRGSKR